MSLTERGKAKEKSTVDLLRTVSVSNLVFSKAILRWGTLNQISDWYRERAIRSVCCQNLGGVAKSGCAQIDAKVCVDSVRNESAHSGNDKVLRGLALRSWKLKLGAISDCCLHSDRECTLMKQVRSGTFLWKQIVWESDEVGRRWLKQILQT
jgi:hypothetical protein